MCDGNTKSNEESSSDEHGEIDTDRLHDHAEDHNNAADHDAGSSTQVIRNVRHDRKCNDRTNGHNGVEKASRSSVRLVERYVHLVKNLIGHKANHSQSFH